jgi:RNA-directed DNA polymerase
MGLWNSIKKGLGMGAPSGEPAKPAEPATPPGGQRPDAGPASSTEPVSGMTMPAAPEVPANNRTGMGMAANSATGMGLSLNAKTGIFSSPAPAPGRTGTGSPVAAGTSAGTGAPVGLRSDDTLAPALPKDGPLKPNHLRKVVRDARLAPKGKKKHYSERQRVMTRPEALQLFSDTYRTSDRNLRDLQEDPAQLARFGLPAILTLDELARALELTPGQLNWMATHRKADKVLHYVTFAVPKRSGGERLIMAPKKRLKTVQRKLHEMVINKLPVSAHAHGFVPGKSVKSNATMHQGRPVILKLDIKDFFPSVHLGRVRGLLVSVGYSYVVATAMACLMTEAIRQPVKSGEQTLYVPVGSRFCVQGAPTSPGICNAVLHRMDRRLGGLARRMGCTYSRYADDLTFSGAADMKVAVVHAMAKRIVEAEGFEVNGKKTKVSRKGSKQEVTGVNVAGGELGISRKNRRKVRAAVHQLKKLVPDSPEFMEKKMQVLGKLAWVGMINPGQARKLKEKM